MQGLSQDLGTFFLAYSILVLSMKVALALEGKVMLAKHALHKYMVFQAGLPYKA